MEGIGKEKMKIKQAPNIPKVHSANLEDSTSNGKEGMNPTAGGRVHLLIHAFSWSYLDVNEYDKVLTCTSSMEVGEENQEAKDLLLKLFTKATPKKIKDNDRNVVNGMVVSMEEALKNKLEGVEDQGKASNLKSSIEVLQEKKVILGEEQNPKYNKKWINIKMVSEQPPFEGYGNFSPHVGSYEHNSYDFYEGIRFGTRNDVRDGGSYVNMDERFHKRKSDYEGYYDSYNYGGYNYRKGSQTLVTTSRPPSYNNLKLPFCGLFMESLFYSYCVREEEKFQLVLKSLSYEVNVWWDSKCENRSRMGAQPIKTWSIMK
ncbi:hypothetical protein M9H77_18867 [Catharanthus roseus]|uniref:Uncharacterized protein n=1 Tax=Catharanthus roseus TaxID=4058 RepID=A0ACC0B8R9_CATRO|nr:hypothetical protein M9H77_18867 [Catharanthus roseus]